MQIDFLIFSFNIFLVACTKGTSLDEFEGTESLDHEARLAEKAAKKARKMARKGERATDALLQSNAPLLFQYLITYIYSMFVRCSSMHNSAAKTSCSMEISGKESDL